MADRVFTGDTLLIGGTGRTDFQNTVSTIGEERAGVTPCRHLAGGLRAWRLAGGDIRRGQDSAQGPGTGRPSGVIGI